MAKINHITLDDTDQRIIKVLKDNSKLSYREIAKRLLMPVTTVHNRIRKLEKNSVIKKYSIILNNKIIGKEVCAYILIKVDYHFLKLKNLTQHELGKKLKSMDDVEDVALITGLRDIILRVRTYSIDSLNKLVTKDFRNVEGVRSTETLVVLDELNY